MLVTRYPFRTAGALLAALMLLAGARAGSIKFPEENNQSQDTRYASILVQPVAGLSSVYGSDGAFFAIARLPQDKRVANAFYGILGNSGGSGGNKFRLGFYGTQAGVSSNRNKLYSRLEGTELKTNAVDEDAFLVVLYRNGGNKGIDWYSLETGEKHVGGSATGASVTNLSTEGPNFMVGGVGSTTPSLGGNSGWPGEIECVGYVNGAVSDATWSEIALGRDVIDALGAANLQWFRQLDETTASWSAPAEATSDSTAPMTLWGVAPKAGSDFRRQSEDANLLADGLSDGWVFGLTAGQTEKAITFNGSGAGFTDDVEVRVVDANSGAIVVDWTNAGPLDNGRWSAELTVPKGGWYALEARAGSLTARMSDEFGVGWKIVQLGQSQTSIYLGSGAIFAPLASDQYYRSSYLSNDSGGMSFYRLGAVPRHGGLAYFINQLRYYDATTPLMIIDEAVNGTSQVHLVTDGQGRDWAPFQEKLDAYGNDVSVVVKNWGTSDMAINEYDEVLDALVYGTGPRAGNHSLNAALQPGWRFAVSPLTRHTGGSAYEGNASQTRASEVAWAYDNGHAVGPPLSDFFIETAGGPHQKSDELMANAAFGARQAVAVARSLGMDDTKNPGFTGLAVIKGDFIRLEVALPNGGNLYSPLPNGLRSFEVDQGSGWQSTGFTAHIDHNTILLTRDSGNWPAGTKVRYNSNLETRVDGDFAAEAAIIGSALYETWAPDVLGLGLPLLGLAGAEWSPDFQTTGQFGATAFSRRFDDWAFTDLALTGSEASADADVEADGRPNLLEFALDGDPRAFDFAAKTHFAVAPGAGEGELVWTIPVREGASFAGAPAMSASVDGLVYTVEAASDLENFDLAVREIVPALSDGLAPLSTGWEYRSFAVDYGVSPAFIRLMIILAP